MRRFREWLVALCTRSNIIFLGGMAGVVHETVFEHSERPTLLILFAAMMGLPAFLTSTEVFPHEDEHKDKTSDKDDPDSHK